MPKFLHLFKTQTISAIQPIVMNYGKRICHLPVLTHACLASIVSPNPNFLGVSLENSKAYDRKLL